jgi:hypothetical protein
VFNTFFYIAILVYQSFYSVSNYTFNQRINEVNNLLVSGKYRKAKTILDDLQIHTIFNNKELNNRLSLINLKLRLLPKDKQVNDFVNKNDLQEVINMSFLYIHLAKSDQAQKLLMEAVIDFPSADSLVCVFEILKAQNFNKRTMQRYNKNNQVVHRWNETEALQLLDMMKKNEKLLL